MSLFYFSTLPCSPPPGSVRRRTRVAPNADGKPKQKQNYKVPTKKIPNTCIEKVPGLEIDIRRCRRPLFDARVDFLLGLIVLEYILDVAVALQVVHPNNNRLFVLRQLGQTGLYALDQVICTWNNNALVVTTIQVVARPHQNARLQTPK